MNTINNSFLVISTPKLDRVTEKYQFISTAEFIKDVEGLGFTLVALQGKGSGYGKHLMKFERPDLALGNGDKIQLLAFTAHDGSSSFKLFLGYYRLVCSNGMMVGTTLESYNVMHVGYAQSKLSAAVTQCLAHVDALKAQVNAMQAQELSVYSALRLAMDLAALRPSLSVADALVPRRDADAPSNVWTILNRVQERVINGGANDDPSRSNVRRISGAAKTVELNRAMWNIAVSHLKQAA